MTYAVLTLGCKLNQADSAAVAGRLGGASLASSVEEADLILLNTCTVTHKADRDVRRLIRSARKANPGAILAVMGCAAKRDAAVFRAMPEVDAVLDSPSALDNFLRDRETAPGAAPYFGERTRAFLKVQEGCDFRCAYCIVPAVRGPSRSVPPGEVVEAFHALVHSGHKEIVLTGINTGEYGIDITFKGGLAGLVERLLALPGDFRIRLNSVEPRAVSPALIGLLRSEPRLCRHLQIPMQSGSDAVLRAMKRNYRTGYYEDLVNRLAEEVPGIGLGADILAGFPAESAENFDATKTLVERSSLAFVHAFSFSPRPGTPAAGLSPLPPAEVHRRTAELRAAGDAKAAAFARRWVGKTVRVLTLHGDARQGRALTDTYLDVRLPEPAPANEFLDISVETSEGRTLFGRLVSARA